MGLVASRQAMWQSGEQAGLSPELLSANVVFECLSGSVSLKLSKPTNASALSALPAISINLEYSYGGEAYSQFKPAMTYELSSGQRMLIRASGSGNKRFISTQGWGVTSCWHFGLSGDGQAKVYGTCSALAGDAVSSSFTYRFPYLFKDSPALVDASSLKLFDVDRNGANCGMFLRCPNLTAAPVLTATQFKTRCYYLMFTGCSSLASVDVGFSTWPATALSATYDWLSGVAPSGVFSCPEGLGTSERSSSRVPSDWTVVYKT